MRHDQPNSPTGLLPDLQARSIAIEAIPHEHSLFAIPLDDLSVLRDLPCVYYLLDLLIIASLRTKLGESAEAWRSHNELVP